VLFLTLLLGEDLVKLEGVRHQLELQPRACVCVGEKAGEREREREKR
jgi:hypothetical protein